MRRPELYVELVHNARVEHLTAGCLRGSSTGSLLGSQLTATHLFIP